MAVVRGGYAGSYFIPSSVSQWMQARYVGGSSPGLFKLYSSQWPEKFSEKGTDVNQQPGSQQLGDGNIGLAKGSPRQTASNCGLTMLCASGKERQLC